MHVHEKSGRTPKKKKKVDGCMSIQKKKIVDGPKKKKKRKRKRNGQMHVHEKKI